jgi:phage gpG-like protein
MAYDFVIQGGERVERALQGLLDNVEDWRALGPEVHEFFIAKQIKLFATEGTSEGIKWPDYSGQEPKYAVYKREMVGEAYADRLLRWMPGREILYPSLVSSRHAQHVWDVQQQRFTFGTRVPYAMNHQKGVGTGPTGERIAQRKIAVLSTASVTELKQIILKFVGLVR